MTDKEMKVLEQLIVKNCHYVVEKTITAGVTT
jgi:hypothetical protein